MVFRTASILLAHAHDLLSPDRGRGWERGLRTSIPPLLTSPPSGGEELDEEFDE
jgi:hypothetical protein